MNTKRRCSGLRTSHRGSNRYFRTHNKPYHHNQPPPVFTDDVKAEAESVFGKVFHYHRPRENNSDQEWTLPSSAEHVMFTRPKWQDQHLRSLKENLNDVKAKLSGMDISEWHQHTQKTNKAGEVIQHVRQTIHPELCTQAWCKFWEILSTFKLGPSMECTEYHSVHLCEAPGAFITCLNHYLVSSADSGKWTWTANTLNPYYEGNHLSQMIDDDRFIFDTVSRWNFGVDNSGDIMDAGNLEDLVSSLKECHVQLVTADGSIDCVDNPGEQENLVSQLHYCEVVAALDTLSPGGALVIKMFTMFEETSINLLYLLCCLFVGVSAFKPACSKSGNSEVYIVCQNFKGMDDVMKTSMMKHVGHAKPQNAMFSRDDLPESFLDQHRKCCQQFLEYQVNTIEYNLQLFQKAAATDWERLENIQACCADMYVDRYKLMPIYPGSKIVPNVNILSPSTKLNIFHPFKSKRRTFGSFDQRQELKHLPWQQKVARMQLHDVADELILHWLRGPCQFNFAVMESWQCVYGVAPPVIQSSQFCDQDLLMQYNELAEHSQQLEAMLSNATPSSQIGFQEGIQWVLSVMKETTQSSLLVKNCGDPDSAFAGLCFEAGLEMMSSESPKDTHDSSSVIHLVNETDDAPFCAVSLGRLLCTLKELKPGDHLVLCCSPLVTRLSAGAVFLLRCCFQQIALFGVTDGSRPEICVAALDCVEMCDLLRRFVDKIQTDCEEVQVDASSRTLLEFVPIQILHEVEFFNSLTAFNNHWLKKRVNYLLQQERAKIPLEN